MKTYPANAPNITKNITFHFFFEKKKSSKPGETSVTFAFKRNPQILLCGVNILILRPKILACLLLQTYHPDNTWLCLAFVQPCRQIQKHLGKECFLRLHYSLFQTCPHLICHHQHIAQSQPVCLSQPLMKISFQQLSLCSHPERKMV